MFIFDGIAVPLRLLLTALADAVPAPAGVGALAAAAPVALAIRLCLLPLTLRARRVQARQAALAPELARIKKKYARDRQRQTAEIAALYRRAGVPLLSGLGVVAVQLVVMTATFRALAGPALRGHPNALIAAQVGGVSLNNSWLGVFAAAGATPLTLAVSVVGAGVVLLLAWVGAKDQPATQPGVRYVSFAVVGFVPFMPLLVASYVVASMTWPLIERPLTHLFT